jgi:hypothetical protein
MSVTKEFVLESDFEALGVVRFVSHQQTLAMSCVLFPGVLHIWLSVQYRQTFGVQPNWNVMKAVYAIPDVDRVS